MRPGTDTAAPRDPLSVVIADDDAIARRAIREALQADDVLVVGEAANGRDAVELSRSLAPDVLVLDLVMPGGDGLEATRTMRLRQPEVPVVILTATDDDELGLISLSAGASGFASKSVDLQALPRTLRAVHAGEAGISRRLTMRLVERFRQSRADGAGLRPVRSDLTTREWEVLDLLCAELSTGEIAERLVLSPETIRSHVKNILRKLGAASRGEAVERARGLRAALVVRGQTSDAPAG